MGRVGRQLKINFVVSVGDNFYQAGLKGPNDPKFQNSFSKVYTARSLQTPWYSGANLHFPRWNLRRDSMSISSSFAVLERSEVNYYFFVFFSTYDLCFSRTDVNFLVMQY